MRWLQDSIVRFRQWAQPAAFRIPVSGPPPLAEAAHLLVSLMKEAEALRQAAAAPPAAPEAPAKPPTGDGRPEGAGEVDKKEAAFAVALCNGCFRLERNIEQLAADEERAGRRPSKELRSLRRAVDALKALLIEQSVEYRDLTDERYDAGREDVELIGEAEERPGLQWKIVARCERPAVFVRGQLVQPARGVVARPPKGNSGAAAAAPEDPHPTDGDRG